MRTETGPQHLKYLLSDPWQEMFIDLCSKRQCHRQKDLIRNKEDKEFGCGYSLTFPKDAKNIL